MHETSPDKEVGLGGTLGCQRGLIWGSTSASVGLLQDVGRERNAGPRGPPAKPQCVLTQPGAPRVALGFVFYSEVQVRGFGTKQRALGIVQMRDGVVGQGLQSRLHSSAGLNAGVNVGGSGGPRERKGQLVGV